MPTIKNRLNETNIVDFKKETEALIKKFIKTKKRVSVNFRTLVKDFSHIGRFSHSIHSYPAKLITHIPYFFINNSYFLKDGDIVLDPFCGSGTVLLEALLSNKISYGADANPLARLITKVKVTYIEEVTLKHYLKKILSRANNVGDANIPEIRNRDFWYAKNILKGFSALKLSIEKTKNKDIRDFFLLNLSSISRKLSFADPRISVPVKLNCNRFPKDSKAYNKILLHLNELENIDVFSEFEKAANINIERLSRLQNYKEQATVISDDARFLKKSLDSTKRLKSNSVSLVLTSPPYAGAQKYIRSSSLNLAWLGLGSSESLRTLDKKNIGRENIANSECTKFITGIKEADKIIEKLLKNNKIDRAKIVASYINEMKEALDESIRVLKEGGHIILVIGNNTVSNIKFKTHKYLTTYLTERGLSLELELIDNIKSYGLMTKRNKTADIISLEWILVFKK